MENNLLNKIHLMDCMDLMAQLDDKSIDLAIVDPPYGIEDKISVGGGSHTKNLCKFHNMYSENNKKWDVRPDKKYFTELQRVSENQIIWGGNYFTDTLPITRCWIIWDKDRAVKNFSGVELAWTSLDKHSEIFKYCNNAGFILNYKDKPKVHPTQKPVDLYRWCLNNYAKEGDIIIDTHSGSGSLAIACIEEKFNFIACELDPDYHKASLERLQPYLDQGKLF